MKICVISTPVFRVPVDGYSGLEHLAWQIAAGLRAKGHHVALVAPDGSTCPDVEVFQVGPERQVDERTAYQKYWNLLPGFEVVIDHSWNKWSYVLKAEGVLKAPVIGVMHAPANTMFQSPPPVDRPCVVGISKDQADHYTALFSRPAKYVYNGIDTDFYRPLKLPRTDRFLFLARFSSIKGPDIAIEACREAGVGLDLVGDTTITNEPDFLEHCKRMADGEQIRFLGPASRGACVWHFSRAHCMLHPNERFREPFGLAPVEAMACGTPVIAWDNGAMRETVTGDAGRIVRSKTELVEAIKAMSGPIPDAIRDLARLNAERFTVRRMIDGYEELCRQAIETGGW